MCTGWFKRIYFALSNINWCQLALLWVMFVRTQWKEGEILGKFEYILNDNSIIHCKMFSFCRDWDFSSLILSLIQKVLNFLSKFCNNFHLVLHKFSTYQGTIYLNLRITFEVYSNYVQSKQKSLEAKTFPIHPLGVNFVETSSTLVH